MSRKLPESSGNGALVVLAGVILAAAGGYLSGFFPLNLAVIAGASGYVIALLGLSFVPPRASSHTRKTS